MEETKPKREDARIRSTKGRVQEIFLQHLREKPASRISVTQICKEAGINRTTFYKHYLDVFDLLDKTERELQTSFREAVGRIRVTGVVQTLTEILCAGRAPHRQLLPALCRQSDVCRQQGVR